MKKIISIILMLFITLSLSSCSLFEWISKKFDDDLNDLESLNNSYLDGFNYVSKRELNKNEVSDEYRDIALEKNEDYDVTYEEVTATSSYSDICALGTLNSILYPGSIIDMSESALKQISIKKAPLTISANLESVLDSTNKIAITIEEPKLSTVRTGIQEIIANNVGNIKNLPSRMSIDFREINSVDEFYLNLGMGVKYGSFEIDNNFDYKNLKKQTNLAIVIKQVYYTIDIDHETIYSLINNSVTNREVNKIFNGKIPGYVSSVSYGRIAILTIQSDYSQNDIKNMLNTSWNKDGNGLSINFTSAIQNIAKDKNTTINYLEYGGGEKSSSGLLDMASVPKFIETFKSYNIMESAGLPISYTIQNWDGSPAKNQSTAHYVTKKITYNPKRIMSWDSLNSMISDGTLFEKEELSIDLSAMIDIDNISDSLNNANRTIVIPKNIKKVCIIGGNDFVSPIEFNNLSIKAYVQKDKKLEIYLKNITFNGDQKNNNGIAITTEGEGVVDVIIEGEVTIKGNCAPAINSDEINILGEGTLNVFGGLNSNAICVEENLKIDIIGECNIYGGYGTMDNKNGGIGIICDTASLYVSKKLTIYGGEGYGDITPGSGGIGMKCDEIIILSENVHIYGGNGGDAQKKSEYGASGNDGGSGGIGLVANTLKTEYTLYCYGGNGGRGADGVAGLKGATGGLLEYGQDNYGEPGQDGGNGGNGGLKGDAFLIQEGDKNKVIGKSGIYGIGGNGGNGGNGGTGGFVVYLLLLNQWRGGAGGNGGNGGSGSTPGKGGLGGIKGDVWNDEYYPITITFDDNYWEDGKSGKTGEKLD